MGLPIYPNPSLYTFSPKKLPGANQKLEGRVVQQSLQSLLPRWWNSSTSRPAQNQSEFFLDKKKRKDGKRSEKDMR